MNLYPKSIFRNRLIMVLFFSSLLFHSLSAQQVPIAHNGIIDLRQTDLSSNKIRLDGEWGLCWQQLCEPGEKESHMTGLTPFPKRWDDTLIGGSVITPKGYASYMLTVLLPHHAKNLALDVPDTYTSYKLFVNNELFVQSGVPGKTKENTIPQWRQFTRELFPVGDTLRLILQVANFEHSKGGPYKSIVITIVRLNIS